MRTISLLCGAILLCSGFTSQPNPPRCIQFVVLGLSGYEQCAEIDSVIRQKEGVLMTRTDFNSQNYLARLTDDCALTEDDFLEILSSFNVELMCFSDQSWTQDFEVRKLNPKDCDNGPADELK